VYEVVEDADPPFIVLEYVEGTTLAERIAQRALPLDLVLRYGRQIADALAHAHEHGIVHRDLKSANVVVTSDGRAKVLDFGLARQFTPEALDTVRNSRHALKDMEAVAGTLPYMAPELLRGEPADARSEIWALGVLLHEMASGTLPFEGQTAFELTAAILGESARPLAHGTSRGLRVIVARCLAKEPGQRYRRISEVSAALEAIQLDREVRTEWPTLPNFGNISRWWRGRGSMDDLRSIRVPLRWQAVSWLTATFVIVTWVIALIIGGRLRPSAAPVDAPEMRFEIVTPSTPDPRSLALSPDGRQLVFVAAGDGSSRLWLRSLDAVTARPLAGTEGAAFPFWSPDSRSIGFFADDRLKRLDVDGGSPQTLTTVRNGRGGTWNADGVVLFAMAGNRLLRIPATGGEVVPVTQPNRAYDHRFPQFLPDGRHFIFLGTGRDNEQGAIYFTSLDDPAHATRLTASDTAAAFIRPGWLFYVQGGLQARRFDVARGALIGNSVTVTNQVGADEMTRYGFGGFSASASGLVAYRANVGARSQLTWVDRSGRSIGVLDAPDGGLLLDPELSPDGRRVALAGVLQHNTDVWVLAPARREVRRFTFEPGVNRWPLWSPDGASIVFARSRGALDLYQKPSNGTGGEEMFLESTHQKVPLDWSPDGRFLLYFENDPQTGRDLWVLPMVGERRPMPFLKTRFEERGGQFSPDGRWIAYQSNATGRFEIYVRPFPGPGDQWQMSTNGGITPRWRRDGQELFYLAPDATLMAVRIRAMETVFEADPPAALFKVPIVGGSEVLKPQYAVSNDGRFLMNLAAGKITTAPITVIANWKGDSTSASR
jgi:Tol biopolymer transport system component